MLLATTVGLGVLIAGVALYLFGTRSGSPRRHSVQVVAWLIMALAPVFLVFTYFPSSTASGTLSGFSMGGAFAAFVMIWWLGSRRTIQLQHPDTLERELTHEREMVTALRDELERERTDAGSAVLAEQQVLAYRLASRPGRCVAIVTGDIDRVTFAGLWVNSENCEMQMSRFFEGTLSARIRYYGSIRDAAGYVTQDLVADELAEKMAGRFHVVPGTVILTGPGELGSTHGVRAILHAAVVSGAPGIGYTAVPNIGECMRNVLAKAEDTGLAPQPSSIICPLLGTGSGKAGIEPTARAMVAAAIDWLQDNAGAVQTLYLLAYRERELEVLRKILDTSGVLVPASAP
jgi:O-acetyl-ADP-ribose deacetylase (regulator of RNase III)